MLGFQGKTSRLYFSFSSFLFPFFFFFFLEDNIGLQIWVTQTYPRLPTYLRPAFQSERRHANLQPIEIIWSAVCELASGGNFQVELAGTSIDQNLIQAWNLF